MQNVPVQDAFPYPAQPRNQLHGVTLEAVVLALQARYGWDDLAVRIPVRCFSHDPQRQIEPEISAQDAVGTSEGGRALFVHASGRKA